MNSTDDKVYFLKWVVVCTIVFLIVWTLNHSNINQNTYAIYFNWELAIPLVPLLVFPYLSFTLLGLVPFFILRKKEIKELALAFIIGSIIAAIVFVILPTERGFVRIVPEGITAPIFEFILRVDTEANLVPSLHVIYVMLYYFGTIPHIFKQRNKVVFSLLIGLIVLSTLFTHQHHIADILTGILVAYGSMYLARRISYLGFRRHPKSVPAQVLG